MATTMRTRPYRVRLREMLEANCRIHEAIAILNDAAERREAGTDYSFVDGDGEIVSVSDSLEMTAGMRFTEALALAERERVA